MRWPKPTPESREVKSEFTQKSFRLRDLHIGDDVGVAAFFIAGIYSRRGIAVVRAIGDRSIYIRRNRVQ